MSVDLEAARLLTHYAAWLSDTQGPTPATLSALYRAKYFVGEAVTRVTRTAMTLGGAHALFKTVAPRAILSRRSRRSRPVSRRAISVYRRSACSSWASIPATSCRH
jgi:alkylation response protein AidB-like acyl-CoA dehydrogenase